MARNLSRNTELFISTIPPATFAAGACVGLEADPADGGNNTWKVNVLDGFSFSQDVATQEIGVSESSSECTGLGQLARGTLGFNTALNPVDVSFSTYVRPYNDSGFGLPMCVELPLWAGALGNQDALTASPAAAGTGIYAETIAGGGDILTFSTEMSDVNELLPLYLYFKLETTVYVVSEFQVGTAEVDFSIDGIATINWSGNGTTVQENESIFDILEDTGTFVAGTDYIDVPTTTAASFLRNKLSTMELVDNQLASAPISTTITTPPAAGHVIFSAGGMGTDDEYVGGRIRNTEAPAPDEWVTILSHDDDDATISAADATISNAWSNADTIEIYLPAEHAETIYCIPITGGTLTLENNITYLTPEELAIVNQPLSGFTGNRAITGSVTAYLNTGAQGSGGLLQDLLAKITEVSNDYAITLHMGGTSSDETRVDFTIAHAQVSIPSTNVEDVISTEISFNAKSWVGTKQSFEGANEMTIGYYTPGS